VSDSSPQPTFSNSSSRKPSKPTAGSLRPLVRLIVAAVLVLLLVLAVVVFRDPARLAGFLPADDSRGGGNVAAPSGDAVAEREAAAKLEAMKFDGKSYLVVSERVSYDSPEKHVTSINLNELPISDEAIALVPKLYRVITVNASRCKIANDQLKCFKGLSILNNLILDNTPITDEGLVYLRPLSNLGALYLNNTNVSDRGLDDVASLRRLKILNLSGTKVTDAGMKKLLPLEDVEWLLLSDSEITDAGLDQLAGMKRLSRLSINGAKVTAEGIDRLKKAIPRLSVDK
jgi:hypothetical protein